MDVFMPHLGASVDKGKILTWHKAVGDAVGVGEILLEVETDKTSIEIEATHAGKLGAIFVEEGNDAAVGEVIATVQIEGEADVPAPKAAPAPTPEAAPSVSPAPESAPARPAAPVVMPSGASYPAAGTVTLEPYNDVRSPARNFGPATLATGVKVSPLARRLATEGGVALANVSGSGPRGRIMARDILAGAAAGGAAASAAALAPAPVDLSAYAAIESRAIPLDRMRSTIAARLTAAKRDIPHFYIAAEVEIDSLIALRSALQEAHGRRITINDFLVRALALGVVLTPGVNRIFAEDRLLEFDRVDLGVAVAVDGGLMTPVVRDAGRKSLLDIAADTADLIERARARKLRPHDIEGGVGSLSNLGMFGVDSAQAIINPPQAFIVAVGAGRRRPRENSDGSVSFVTAATLTVSADHRVLDGAVAASFLSRVKALVETPVGLLQ